MATSSVQHGNYADAIAFGIGFANRASDQHGKLRIMKFDVETAASAAGEVISLGVLPAGATYFCTLLGFEGTASLTLSIGDADDVDRLVAGAKLEVNTPGTAAGFSSSTGEMSAGVIGLYSRMDSTAFGTVGPGSNVSSGVSVGFGYRYTTETVITATTAGATATAGEVIRGAVIYSLE